MRAFIAIELPKEIKDFLGSLQEELKKSGADVKWVMPRNIHLTLKFLGEIDEQKLNKVKEVLENIAENKNYFSLSLSSLGAFPKIDSPRVIWVGIEAGAQDTIKEIAQELERKIAEAAGIPKEKRPFSSHITLGRLRSSLNMFRLVRELKISASSLENKPGFNVTKFTLFKSTLTLKGPIYEILKEVSLKAK